MVEPITTIILGALIATAVYEFVKRPLADLLSGLILTEEAPVRTAVTMYIAGAVDLSYVNYVFDTHNIKQQDRAAYLAWANMRIAESKQAEELQKTKVVTSHMDKLNTAYDKLEDNANDIELDTFVQDVKNKIADLDAERDVFKALFTTAAKKGKGTAEYTELLAVNKEIADLNMLVFDKRKEIIARKHARLDAAYEKLKEIQPTLPVLPAPTYPPSPTQFIPPVLAPAPAPAPTPTPTPTSTTTAFVITSTVSPADVYFDNVKKGSTPLTIEMPATASYLLEVKLSDYVTWGVSTLAEAGKSYAYQATMIKAVTPTTAPGAASYYVTSTPPGADIYFNKSYIGKTPIGFNMPADGIYDVEIRMAGYNTYSTKAASGSGYYYTIGATLTQVSATAVSLPTSVTGKYYIWIDVNNPAHSWTETSNTAGPIYCPYGDGNMTEYSGLQTDTWSKPGIDTAPIATPMQTFTPGQNIVTDDGFNVLSIGSPLTAEDQASLAAALPIIYSEGGKLKYYPGGRRFGVENRGGQVSGYMLYVASKERDLGSGELQQLAIYKSWGVTFPADFRY